MAVLSANRQRLIAYNTPEVIKQVDEIVERFVDATDDTLKVQVQFIAAVDPRWRYTVYSRLTYVGGGPQGQQIWTMQSRDAALVLTQMQIQQGFRQLFKDRLDVINGQTFLVKVKEPRTFVGGLQQDPAGGATFQPRPGTIEEAITLKLSPLLNYDGNAVNAKIDLAVNTVRMLHRTKVIAPREIGPIETSIDVPDATQTHLEQTVRNWRLGQSLIISCGVHPGILDKKTGLFNLPIPGTYPTATEVLVFLEIEPGERARVRAIGMSDLPGPGAWRGAATMTIPPRSIASPIGDDRTAEVRRSDRIGSFAGRLLPLVERQPILEPDAAAPAEIHGSLQRCGDFLADHRERLGLPGDGGPIIAGLGVSGRERVEAIGIAPLRQLTGPGRLPYRGAGRPARRRCCKWRGSARASDAPRRGRVRTGPGPSAPPRPGETRGAAS